MRLPGEGALTSASPGVGSKLPQHPPAGEVVISMRPVSVFANGPGSEIEQLKADLHGRWRQATRAVMVLLSRHRLAAPQIAELPLTRTSTLATGNGCRASGPTS